MFMNKILKSLSCRLSLSYWYNLGSLLGITMAIQIIRGLLLLLDYRALNGY